jgi:histidine ammonia-lyase
MHDYIIDNQHLELSRVLALAHSVCRFRFADAVHARLAADRAVVEQHLEAGEPVYGLNTGLGGNIGYRLSPHETLAWQRQIIAGRMIGVGEPLPDEVVRTALLLRVCGLARGGTGVSPQAASALLALLDQRITPVVPRWGSIGAGDLGLSAHLVAATVGLGQVRWRGRVLDAAQALQEAGLEVAALQAKDGLGMINASPITAALGVVAVREAARVLLLALAVAALSAEGYAANLTVLDPRIAGVRDSGAQVAVAALMRALLEGSPLAGGRPRSVQDAVSMRTPAQNFGAAYAVLGLLHDAVEGEVNGCSDSPLVLVETAEMLSTANFHTPMIAVAADALAIALVQLSAASVQRIIKLQTPHLSGLPKYLSPVGGASVGFNAMQKTAAALHAQVRLHASPAALDAFPVSDTVEDHAPQTPLALRKLGESLRALRHLVAIEALVAAQAVDLRQAGSLGAGTQLLQSALRAVVPALAQDRPPGPDAAKVEALLFADPVYEGLRSLVSESEDAGSLRRLL